MVFISSMAQAISAQVCWISGSSDAGAPESRVLRALA
jgi:hypothetical protein